MYHKALCSGNMLTYMPTVNIKDRMEAIRRILVVVATSARILLSKRRLHPKQTSTW